MFMMKLEASALHMDDMSRMPFHILLTSVDPLIKITYF